MSKGLRTIGMIAGAVALVATGAGALGALGGLTAGSAATSISTYASLAATVANIGAMATAKVPKQIARGSLNQRTIGANQALPYLMGEAYSAGIQLHDVGYGATLKKVPNPYRLLVVCHSCCGPVEGLVENQADFTTVPFTGNAATGSYFDGFLYRSYQLGQRPEGAALAPQWAGAPGWDAAHKLSGMAAEAYSFLFDKDGKVFASGIPAIGSIWRGVKAYDPRKDSTYPGGSGAHRITDETTWTYTRNPALHALAYAYGRWVNGKKVFGVDLKSEGILLPPFVAWANLCDLNGWTVNGQIFEPGDKWNNLKLIAQAGSAEPYYVGGPLSVRYDAPRISLDTITLADLAGDELSAPAMKPWAQRLNTIIPRFRSPAHQWAMTAGTAVVDSTSVAEDGETKSDEVPLQLVTNATQAAQLAGYRLANSRERGPITIRCKPRLIAYSAGDCLTLSSDVAAALAVPAGKCVVLTSEIDAATGIVSFTLETETDAKHDFALGRTTSLPPTVPPPSSSAGDGVAAAIFLDPALDASAAAAAAQATADSKNAISWGATPPAADDSVEDDRWADASNGYVEYRRLAGSGRLSNSGVRVVCGGVPLLARPWALAPDSRIGYAVATADQGIIDAAAARARADAAGAAASDAIDRLDDLADDGVLTESEKKTVLIPQDARLEGAWTVLDAQAASYGVTTERTAAAAARTAWQTYRNALSPAWNNDDLPTAGINRTVYRQKLLDYETALTTLTKAITQVAKDAASIADAKAVAAQADATSGLAQVAIIRSNGYLDVSEKPAIKRQVTSYSAEYGDIVAKAAAAGVSSAVYVGAYSDLITYLATLSPAWDNLSLDTAITPSTFDGKFNDYLFARQQLLNGIADAIRAKAAAAQATADSKTKSIPSDTAPLAADTAENDEWVDTANGNIKYQRLAGSGALANSGTKVVCGGVGLLGRPWKRRRDFGIEIAQLAAQGAQTTADGKNKVFPPSTVAPVAEKVGDLWPNPVTGDVKIWNGTSWVLTSDQTALTQVVVEINPRAVTVAADYLGSLGTGWSHTITPKVTRGGADVRAASISTYAITTSNLTATVNNTAGSASKGAVTVTDFSTDDGAYYELVATVGGIAQPPVRVNYSKKRSSPPPAATGTDSKSTDAFTPLTATTATAIIADMSVNLASGQRLVGTAGLDYYVDGTGSSPVSRTATAKWLYYAGGVWNDFDTAITGSGAFQEWTDAEGNTASRRPGHGEFNQAKSGLSAGTYPCRLVAYQNASGLTMTFSGVATIEAKP